MSEIKAALFDADGVTIISGDPFSVQYANKNGLDPKTFEQFFDGDFQEAMIGRADLKDLLEKHRDIWHLEGDVDKFMKEWFEAENHPNVPLVKIIERSRENGIHCYLVTNQEKYRTEFIRNTMFPEVFDEIFSSSEIGAMKPSEDYFQAVLGKLAVEGIKPEEIVYFDDSQRNVDAASELGIRGLLYQGVDDVKDVLGVNL